MTRALVYGAGGHGKVVADILFASDDFEVLGFVDDCPDKKSARLMGLRVLGDREWLLRACPPADRVVALGIGDNRCRKALASQLVTCGVQLLVAIHPSAVVSRSAKVDTGAVVMAGAIINPDAHVAAGAIINTGAIVEHDCVIGEFAHVSPNAALGGAARLGALSHLGLGAAVLPGVRVGNGTIVGAGAVVARDLPDYVVAMGVPARVHRATERQ